MIDLPRLRPEPIPAIHPLPEYLAEGERKEIYEDVKRVLQVPWMGVVTMAYAHYPHFFGTLWRGTRSLCLSHEYVAGAQALRAAAEAAAADLSPPPMAERLEAQGYARREIGAIRDMIEVFSHGNHLYFVLALITRLLLEGGAFGEARDAPAFQGRHAPAGERPFLLMEAHHADEPTRALYDDIKATLGLPFVNTDYRALARWPSYFAMAWRDLKPLVAGAAYEGLCRSFHDRGVALIARLPNPEGLTSAALRAAAEEDATLEEVSQCARLFAYLLPGLTLNVACFRHQLIKS